MFSCSLKLRDAYNYMSLVEAQNLNVFQAFRAHGT